MNQTETEAVIRDFYKRRLANDVDTCMAVFAPDACVQLAGSPEASSIACTVRGETEVHALLGILVATWHWTDVEFLSIIVNGNKAAVHYRLTTEFTPTSETAVTEIVDIHTVENGKIVEFIEFVDTARAADLARQAAAVA